MGTENKLEPKTRPKNTSKSDFSRKKNVENDRFFVAQAAPFPRGNSDGDSYCITLHHIWHHTRHRRMFRSQTSDNIDSWKSRGGKSQRREEEEERRMQVREKVGKSQNTVFFQWFVALEGQKVGSLKRRARSHLAR